MSEAPARSGRPILILILVGLLLIGGGAVIAGRYFRGLTLRTPPPPAIPPR